MDAGGLYASHGAGDHVPIPPLWLGTWRGPAAGVPAGGGRSALGLNVLLCLPWQVYESGSNVDQFVTRFLLKETANQTQSLLSSVESAVDAIDEQTNPARSAAPPALLPARRLFFGWRERRKMLLRGEGEHSGQCAGANGGGERPPFSLPPFLAA